MRVGSGSLASCTHGRYRSVTKLSKRDNSRRETFWYLREPGGQRTHSDAPGVHPAHPELCHNRAIRTHRAQVRVKLRTLSRCRVSRSNSRVAHRSCSRRTPLISVTTSAPSAAVSSSLQCVFNVCTVVVRTRLQVHCECVVRSNLTKPFKWKAQPARMTWDQSRLSCVHDVQFSSVEIDVL